MTSFFGFLTIILPQILLYCKYRLKKRQTPGGRQADIDSARGHRTDSESGVRKGRVILWNLQKRH